MRYNFHDQLARLHTDAGHVLPVDINAPIRKYLAERGFLMGALKLDEYQQCARYGTFFVSKKVLPDHRIKIHVDAGMVGEIVELHHIEVGKEIVDAEFTIKNENLDKRNPNKGAKK
jgi:hypothetical protein